MDLRSTTLPKLSSPRPRVEGYWSAGPERIRLRLLGRLTRAPAPAWAARAKRGAPGLPTFGCPARPGAFPTVAGGLYGSKALSWAGPYVGADIFTGFVAVKLVKIERPVRRGWFDGFPSAGTGTLGQSPCAPFYRGAYSSSAGRPRGWRPLRLLLTGGRTSRGGSNTQSDNLSP